MPKTRAQRRIDNNGSMARRVVNVIGGTASLGGGTVPTHSHPIYTTPDEAQALIDLELASLGLGTAGTWTISGSVGYIDLVHAAGDSTLQILNSDGTYKANVQIEGDLTVLGTVYGTGPLTGEEWLWSTTDNMYISANYAAGPSTVQILNDSATYKASLFVEDKITTGGDISITGNIIGQTLQYPDTALYLEANNVSASTVYVRNTDPTEKASLNVEDDISAGGDIAATGNVSGVDGTFTGNAAVTGTLSVTGGVINDFFVDTNVLFVDVSENRVGINDSTPSYGLDVNGTFRATGAAQFDSTVAITDDLNVDSGALFVDASANRVGINDSTPSYGLDVNGTFRTTGTATLDGAATVGGTLGVTGIATFQSNVVAQAALSVGTDLTVADDATITDELSVGGTVTLTNWSIDGVTGTMQTTGAYAFVDNGALQDITGIRLQPSTGMIDAERLEVNKFYAETLVIEEVSVLSGDMFIAKSRGKLAAAVTINLKHNWITDGADTIVTDGTDQLVFRSGTAFTITVEHPASGPYPTMEEGDQIMLSGLATAVRRAKGAGVPFSPARWYPAVYTDPAGNQPPIKLKAYVTSVTNGASSFTATCVPVDADMKYDSITYAAGTAVVVFGGDGDAYLSLTSRAKSAFMDVGYIAGNEWAGAGLTPTVRVGDIGGLSAVASPGDVGIVGGPGITSGTGEWFRLAQDGVTLQNGTVAVRDSGGVLRTAVNSTGINMLISDFADTDGYPWTNEALYASAITFVNDVDDPDAVYGGVTATRTAGIPFTGTYGYSVSLRGEWASDASSVSSSLIAGDSDALSTAVVAARYTPGAASSMVITLLTDTTDDSYIRMTSAQVQVYAPKIQFAQLPTSPFGLSSGMIWNDGGTVKIVS